MAKMAKPPGAPPKGIQDKTNTVIFGGLDDFSLNKSEEWVRRKLKELNLDEPMGVYMVGEGDFQGRIKAKF